MTPLQRVAKEDLEDGSSYFVKNNNEWLNPGDEEWMLFKACDKACVKFMRDSLSEDHLFYGPIEIEGE